MIISGYINTFSEFVFFLKKHLDNWEPCDIIELLGLLLVKKIKSYHLNLLVNTIIRKALRGIRIPLSFIL